MNKSAIFTSVISLITTAALVINAVIDPLSPYSLPFTILSLISLIPLVLSLDKLKRP